MTLKFRNDKHFEECVVQALIVDQPFAEQMVEVLDLEYFNLEHLKETVRIMFNNYEQHKVFPSLRLIWTIAKNDYADNDLMRDQITNFLVKIKNDPLNGDLEYVKEQSLDFCKKRSLALAMESSLDLIQEKKYEQIVGLIQKAILAGSERDVGHIFHEHFEKRMVVEERATVPTPWIEINDITRGGLAPGELGVLCAPTGVGKSHGLVDIGQHAATLGYNVVHYTFELGDIHVGRRYDARLSGIAPEQLVENRDTVKEAVDNLKGKVIIKSYPTKSATTLTLKNHLHKLVLRDFKPDLMVVDYGDLMRSQHKYEQKRLEEESVYEDLRGLAQELNIPIWTATQTNRDGLDAEVITLKHVAECFGKAMISDLFITMNRKKENGFNSLGTMFVAKSRLGPDGMKYPVLINTSLSKLEVLSPDSLDVEDGPPVSSSQDLLKKKFRELQKNGQI